MNYTKKFDEALKCHDKHLCFNILEDAKKHLSIIEIYEIFGNILQHIGLPDEEGKYNIVEEHLYSNIISVLIDNCFDHVLKQSQNKLDKTVLICGLENELHDIGLKMIRDFFQIAGYNSVYLGVNIPNVDIIEAIKLISPEYIAISITNFYHLSNLGNLIEDINKSFDIKIILGGNAVLNNYNFVSDKFKPYRIISNYKEIFELEANHETSV